MKELSSRLAGLLPGPPARILGLGRPIDGPAGPDLIWVDELGGADPRDAPFEAALWNCSEGSGEGRAQAERLVRLLPDPGRVIVVARRQAITPGRFRRRGSLPTRQEASVRAAVRHLSENGFSIDRDEELAGPGGDEEPWILLTARRDAFAIRSYRDGDEEAILRLFERSFHVRRSLEHWRWKYRDNPWGRHKISLAFSPGEELAVHYGAYPVPYWRHPAVQGQPTFLGLQMGDTMSLERYRTVGRGHSNLLARTVRHFFSIHRDGGYGLFYGFNTGPIQRFCLWFIGGSRVEPVRYWARELEAGASPEPWAEGGYRVERVGRVDGSWDRFFRRVAPSYGFLVWRGAKYVDWRYLRCPDSELFVYAARRWGRLVGWSVFRRREDRLVWGDALFDPRHTRAAGSILAAALGEPSFDGVKKLEGWFSESPSWWGEELRALGFENQPEAQDLALMALADTGRDVAEMLRELYYTMGDGDLF